MTIQTFLLNLILSTFALYSHTVTAASEPVSGTSVIGTSITGNNEHNQILTDYKATYDVLRNGKIMAEQQTKLKKLSPSHYTLNDVTKGTHGLASFTGFERSEDSEFTTQGLDWKVQQHHMQQKVTFSKRNYSFEQNEQSNQIEGIHKKEPFLLHKLKAQPIASHMLPLRIAQLACREQKSHFGISVLKSKRISSYRFNAITQNDGLIKVDRKYPSNSGKSSHIWLDPKQQCITVKSKHIDDNEVLETKISAFNSKAVAQ